ncbi:MAG: single-stranded DNA-binding protein [Akkermansia sp.]|nr:single-stranded DNA-binding protein [Akkermansia sp.]MCD8071340.1 single-stranded DNA-binding protein [Akkermansiaceae bacterium]
MRNHVEEVLRAARELSEAMGGLRFGHPVAFTYNPLDYAWPGHEAYVRRFASGEKSVLYLGMNPGPFGMAQTGVPFGEVDAVTRWMGIRAEVGRPGVCHPKRPVQGFECPRSEVSGRRLWGLFESLYGTAESFFAASYVANYCPLIWMNERGANITPAQLPADQAGLVDEACQAHLRRLIEILRPKILVGIGAYAARKLESAAAAFPGLEMKRGVLLHPSPASPAANKYWPERPMEQLRELGIIPAGAPSRRPG